MKNAPVVAALVRIKEMLTIVLMLVTCSTVAREISPDEAGRAAAAWGRRDRAPLGVHFSSCDVAEVRTAKGDGGTPLFHVVRMAGGGAVVTSAESGVMPVIAFLEGDGVEVTAENPLWEILNADMSNRLARVRAVREAGGTRFRASAESSGRDALVASAEAAWAELLGESEKGGLRLMAAAISDTSPLSDLRVPALLATKWDQSSGAGNYNTPPYAAGDSTNYPCGCVALAGAQIAYFWRFPAESRPQVDRLCYVEDEPCTYRTMGGLYDWTNMPPLNFYSAPLSTMQRQAVGKLCYDFGVATKMNWWPSGLGGSDTVCGMLADAFTSVFGYANAMAYTYDGDVLPDHLVERSVLANLDAGSPVVVGLDGHSVVADGYGYESGTLYTHLNFGWSGVANAWYNLPEVDVSAFNYTSTVLDNVVYNIFPTNTGELITGRVLDRNGNPISGTTVIATSGSISAMDTTDGHGIYALHVTGGRQWTVVATIGGSSGSCSADVAASSSAMYLRDEISASILYSGAIGNSWGNDITLDVDASEPQPVVPSTGYAAWAAENSLGAADAVTDGQPNLIRYVFNKPSGAFSPFTGLTFQNGDPVLWFQPFNPGVSNVTLSVLSTTNLLDWAHAMEFLIPGPPFNSDSIVLNHPDTAPARFYKLKVEE